MTDPVRCGRARSRGQTELALLAEMSPSSVWGTWDYPPRCRWPTTVHASSASTSVKPGWPTSSPERVDLLSRDRQRLARHLQRDSLRLTTEPAALSRADAVVVCVPTPIDAHQSPDLRALSGACAAVVDNATPGQTIVVTSTTYVGCTRELIVKPLSDRGLESGRDVFVAFSPERIDPGVEAHAPDSTPRVVGGVTAACASRAAELLAHTASAIHPVSSPEAAEMTKLVENTFRAVNIALANEFSDAARELNVDVIEVISAAATKPYGFMPFYPGPGVGGHCIPCDPHYLLWQLRARRFDSPVTRSAMTAIALRPREVVSQARRCSPRTGVRPTALVSWWWG